MSTLNGENNFETIGDELFIHFNSNIFCAILLFVLLLVIIVTKKRSLPVVIVYVWLLFEWFIWASFSLKTDFHSFHESSCLKIISMCSKAHKNVWLKMSNESFLLNAASKPSKNNRKKRFCIVSHLTSWSCSFLPTTLNVLFTTWW